MCLDISPPIAARCLVSSSSSDSLIGSDAYLGRGVLGARRAMLQSIVIRHATPLPNASFSTA